MNRCPDRYDPANHLTQCFLDPGHDGNHRWYGDPMKPPVEWPAVVSLVDRIIGRIGL